MKLLVALIISLTVVICHIWAAPAEDEIIDLPGLQDTIPFRQYSGYLDAEGGRHLFYWFVESYAEDQPNAPLAFWFNGGPGCSSLDGFMTENGPFRIDPGGQTLSLNPYSWNKVANVVYLESPAGVGFSYSDDGSYRSSDDQTAQDNYVALQNFFVKFPEYKTNSLFLTGESYAGVYIPTLAYLIVNGTNDLNLQGFAVGNGLHDDQLNFNSEVLFDAYHALFDSTLTTRLLTYCCEATIPVTCDFYNPISIDCDNAIVDALLAADVSGVNPYGIYDYCAGVGDPTQRHSRINRPLPKNLRDDRAERLRNLRSDPPCSDSTDESLYLNSAEVKAAIHVSDSALRWTLCSDRLLYLENYSTMFSQYQYLLRHTRALLFNGDIDTVCNYLGGEWFAEKLGRELLQPYRPWIYENQTAGFVKQYSNVTYMTVLGSGHMVPTDRPAQALQLFTNFIFNQPF